MPEFQPAPGVRLFIIDDGAVVYAHAAQKIYAFNTAATFIWCGLELGQNREEVAGQLAATSGIALGEAQRRVSDAVDSWRGLGLLGEGASLEVRQPRRRSRRRPQGRPASALPGYAEARFVEDRVYALLSAAVRVRYGSAEQRDYVHPILAHLENRHAPSTLDIKLIDDGGTHHVCRNGSVEASLDSVDRIGPVVKWLVWEAAVNTHQFLLDIHAGVVGDGEGVMLFPARAGSGKSSLTAALSRAGFDYFSDEIALLEEPGLTVRPIPLAICVKSTGWDLMAPYFPGLPTLKSHRRGDGKTVRYVPPPPLGKGSDPSRSYPVRRIVFPRYEADAKTALKPLPRVEALRRLLEECLVVPVPLTQRRAGRLVRWIKQIDCYELPMSSLEEAVDLVRSASMPSSL